MSPSDRSSMRHVGEGVLDDSDSAESDFIGDGEDEGGDDTAGMNTSGEEDHAGTQVVSVGVNVPRAFPTPSPLSRLLGHQSWTSDDTEKGKGGSKESDADDSDDENNIMEARFRSDEEGSTPSPQSTDTDSVGGNVSLVRRARSSSNALNPARSRRWSSAQHNKMRSHSSTIASLAAPPRSLSHHDSHSSIRTVTATGSELPPKTSNGRRDDEDSLDEVDAAARRSTASRVGTRPKVYAMSEHAVEVSTGKAPLAASKGHEVAGAASQERVQMTERRIESIRMEDRRFKATTLGALKLALEEFAEEV